MTRPPGNRFIGWASRLVPRGRREDWVREWEAESAYAWRRLNETGTPTFWARLGLGFRTMTCFVDALWEAKETMTTMMNGLMNDVRFALRGLRRHPGFSLVAIVTLALGIGANTAVFTLVDGVLLRPLPFPEPDRLVAIEHLGRDGQDELPMSTGLYLLYREQATSLEELGLYAGTVANLVVEGEPERLQAQAATPSLFTVLGAEAALGRTFLEEEGVRDGEPVVLLSDGLWRSHFGADPGVVGRSVDLNGTLRRIVGVMPPDFGHPDREARLWVPLQLDPATAPIAAFGVQGVGRLAAESSPEGLHAELEGLIGRLAELYPDSGSPAFLAEVGLRSLVIPLKEAVVGEQSATLWILMGTVAFVLLIACANVANLLLVRAESRQRELALRMAVGAGRIQILRSFLSESVILSGAGGALGVVVAAIAVRASLSRIPSDLPRMAEVGLDPRVLGFTALVSLGCALVFGLAPMYRFGSSGLALRLRDAGGRGTSAGPVRQRIRSGLVVTQMALALVLLIGAGLMFRSFQALRTLDPGFDTESIVTARISIPSAEVEGSLEVAALFDQLRESLAAQPGVTEVGFIGGAPLVGGGAFTTLQVEDHPRGPDELPVFSANTSASPGYFEAMGIPIREGRSFRSGDGAAGERAVVVSESFAEHWWPDTSPIGRRLRAGFDGEDWYTIVGVVGDVHQESLEEPPQETVYYPVTVGPAEGPFVARTLDLVVRASGDPIGLVPVIRRELREVNPRIPLSDPQTMAQAFEAATARTSFTMSLLGAASGIALLLGLVGIYGVISYIVSQRTNEIGVRMALGASAANVRSMVVRQGLSLALVGVGIGLLAAFGLSSVMASVLFGISATDPLTYGAVALSLLGVATLACWFPARRAAGVDPARALRQD